VEKKKKEEVFSNLHRHITYLDRIRKLGGGKEKKERRILSREYLRKKGEKKKKKKEDYVPSSSIPC